MQLIQLQYLISNLNINNQLVETKRERWSPFVVHNPDLNNLLDEIFNDQLITEISRDRISHAPTLSIKILLTYFWGFPKWVVNFRSIIQPDNFNSLQEILSELMNNELTNNFYNLLDGVDGVGTSTLTKFLYFLNVNVNHQRCLILDRNIIDVVNSGCFGEFEQLQFESDKVNFVQYCEYNRIIHELSGQMQLTADQLELFLFLFGKIKDCFCD